MITNKKDVKLLWVNKAYFTKLNGFVVKIYLVEVLFWCQHVLSPSKIIVSAPLSKFDSCV